MFCWAMEFGWWRDYKNCSGKTWVVCIEASTWRRRFIFTLTYAYRFLLFLEYTIYAQGTTSTVSIWGKRLSDSRRKEGMRLQLTYWCKESSQKLFLLLWFVAVFTMRVLQFLNLEYMELTCGIIASETNTIVNSVLHMMMVFLMKPLNFLSGTKIEWWSMNNVVTWCEQKFLHRMKVV